FLLRILAGRGRLPGLTLAALDLQRPTNRKRQAFTPRATRQHHRRAKQDLILLITELGASLQRLGLCLIDCETNTRHVDLPRLRSTQPVLIEPQTPAPARFAPPPRTLIAKRFELLILERGEGVAELLAADVDFVF